MSVAQRRQFMDGLRILNEEIGRTEENGSA
jgi:hypothetical protein